MTGTLVFLLSHGPSIFYVPDDVPREPAALRAYVKYMSEISEDDSDQHKVLKSHYQAAMSELHNVPEVQLL